MPLLGAAFSVAGQLSASPVLGWDGRDRDFGWGPSPFPADGGSSAQTRHDVPGDHSPSDLLGNGRPHFCATWTLLNRLDPSWSATPSFRCSRCCAVRDAWERLARPPAPPGPDPQAAAEHSLAGDG